jgi:hypothetical protein
MFRATLGKLTRVVRTTALVVGIATMVAALFGVASMAFAGNGDPWILGQLNSASSTPPPTQPGSPGAAAWTVPCSC